MPPESSPSGSTSLVRQHSPNAAGGSERKRRRKVLSCYDCRRRKLQCDRGMPACGRCTKAGIAARCVYLEDSANAPPQQPEAQVPAEPNEKDRVDLSSRKALPTGDLLSRLEYQDRRIKELEAVITQHSPSQPDHPRTQKIPLTPNSVMVVENPDMPTITANPTDRDPPSLRGKAFMTEFRGASHLGSVLGHIPDLSAFSKETFEGFPTIARRRQELKALYSRTAFARPKPRHQIVTDAELKAALSSKQETDELVQLYFYNYDSIYHIIHCTNFWNEYNDLWAGNSPPRSSFVAIVLLMTAITQCLSSSQPWLYTAATSVARHKALTTIQLCEDWLTVQSQKYANLEVFQVRFLLNLAKLVNASKFKRTWTDAGSFLRFCMAAGLHRNPELLRKQTTAMDKEMRRRIWFATAEFELQAAFTRGMISAPWLQQSDFVPPTNIDDDEFDNDTHDLPAPKALQDFTSTSYLALASDTFVLRYQLNSALNNIRQTLPFDQVKRYTEEIETQLQAIPAWTGNGSATVHVLATTTLRNYLLVLHNRHILQTSSHSELNFSKMVIVDAAKKIIDAHTFLFNQGLHALQYLCHDQTRAALSIFQAIAISDPRADNIIDDVLHQTSQRLAAETEELITHKCMRLGCEQRQLWTIVVANAFMKSRKNPTDRAVYVLEAVDRMSSLYYRLIAAQESTPLPSSSSEVPNTTFNSLPTDKQSKSDDLLTDPICFDFDGLAAWNFDEWNFDQSEFATWSTAL